MAGLPHTLAAKTLDYITKRGTGSVYLALLTEDPGDDPVMADLTELIATGYARQVATFIDGLLDVDVRPPVTSNATQLAFGPFPAGTSAGAGYAALVEAATGLSGLVRYVWILDNEVSAAAGDSILFPIGSTELGW